jgi:transposase
MKSLIVGVDVSKSTLDICFKPSAFTMKVANRQSGFKQWLKELNRLSGPGSEVLVVMEHTGHYSWRFESFLRSKAIDYCKIAALQIKRSAGMIRGKDDKADAGRIADYAWMRREILTADSYGDEKVRELQQLLSLRSKLVRDRSGYISRFKEMRSSGICTRSDCQGRIHQQCIDLFTRQITTIEQKIRSLIASDEGLQKNSQLLRSIKGIGWIIAAYMISCTANFKRFANARKFNCYAGIAPFKHESGSSIKGKARVSHLANKDAKTLLNMGASSAIQHDKEMKEYYQRRVAEGKKKMGCLNIIRSKLVARMFAVIKRQTPYQQVAPIILFNPILKN